MTKVEKEIREVVDDAWKVYDYAARSDFDGVFDILRDSDIVYFVGCGSSYNFGVSASRFLTLRTGMETRFIPGGEITFEFAENVGGRRLNRSAFLISRSGESTEVIMAGEVLKKMGIPTVGITIEPDSSLVQLTDASVVPPIEEESLVMTKSFNLLLLSFEVLVDRMVGKEIGVYENLVNRMEGVLQRSFEIVELEDLEEYEHYVFLGTGIYEGIAREGALKLEEMSLSKVEAYSTYEYRHGPKALVENGVLIVMYVRGEREEEKLREELLGYGGKVVTVGCRGDVETSDIVPEEVFMRPTFAQVLGLKIAERKGLDVENPRNLTKVVRLE